MENIYWFYYKDFFLCIRVDSWCWVGGGHWIGIVLIIGKLSFLTVKRLGSSSYDESYYNIFFLWEGASQQRGHVQLRRVLQHLLPALQWVGASQTCTASGKTSTSTIPSFYTTVGTSTSTTASICEWKAINFFLCYSGGKLTNRQARTQQLSCCNK